MKANEPPGLCMLMPTGVCELKHFCTSHLAQDNVDLDKVYIISQAELSSCKLLAQV